MLAIVTGTGRCGSTLVQELICRHPEVGFVSGLDDKLPRLNLPGRYNSALYRRSSPRSPTMGALRHSRTVLERGRLRVAPSEAYSLFDRHVMAGFSTPCRDLVASDLTPYLDRRLHDFVDRRLRAQGCHVLLQHLTGWPRTGFLRAAYPSMKVVHVVRDGRAVANSWLQMGWWDGWRGPDNWFLGPLDADLSKEWEHSGRSFQALAALGWKMLMRAFAAARGDHPTDQWLDVRYEDLVAAPRDQLERILGFLELDWSAEFDRGFARYQFPRHRGAAYRGELTPAQVSSIEHVLSEPLLEWGYELGPDPAASDEWPS